MSLVVPRPLHPVLAVACLLPFRAFSEAPPGLEERIEADWNCQVEVFSGERDIDTPEGYRILNSPGASAKVLKRMTASSSVGIKAVLTMADGSKVYISGWSWDHASQGTVPTWIRPLGQGTLAPAPAASPDKEAQVASPETAGPAVPETVAIEETGILPTDVGKPGSLHVLLMGNGNYSARNAALAGLDLPCVGNDLQLLTAAFQEVGGQVETLLDGDRAQMMGTIERKVAALQPGDSLVLYYTGHAVQVSGKNFLSPSGVSYLDRDQVRATSVPVDHIMGLLSGKPHRFSALLLDASRPNPFNHVDASTHLSRIIASIRAVAAPSPVGLAEMKSSAVTLVASSASPGTVIPAPAAPEPNTSFAKALAATLPGDGEFREIIDQAGRLVREWSGGAQMPWRGSDSAPLFFPKIPCRKIAAPDEDLRVAATLITEDIEKGFPLALARLARSVRNRPSHNPSTAALLYLLSYQAVPVPLQSWGPFKPKGTEFAPGLKASIDGTYIGLLRAGEESPALIINRLTGEQVSGVEDTFAPSQDATVALQEPGQLRSGDGQPLSTWSIHRTAWDGGQADAAPADPRATSPILKRGKIVASYYDEGLERVYLATLENGRSGSGLFFSEYALTPPVNALGSMRRERDTSIATAAEGTAPLRLAEGKEAAWQLLLDRDGKVALTDIGGARLYERTDGLLDDWLINDACGAILLLFRDQIEVIGIDGKPLWTMGTPWPVDHRGTLLAFSPSFQRIFAAHAPETANPADSTIVAIDSHRREIIAPGRTVPGYPQFAAMSGDGEWFFFYDQARRLRMWDSFTAGQQLDLPSTRVPMPLPLPGRVCETDPLALPSFHALNPPLIGHLPESYNAPLWLPDLAEALAGFRVTNEGTLEWLPNATQKLRDVARSMNKQNRDTHAGEWAVWFLENRLRAIPR
ncbi:MAG: caspase family protein [Verrucomicrobia bacterium]|nr:caspase family protein [Verrucomicrobiota bacterium]